MPYNEEELRDHHTSSLAIIDHKGRLLMSVSIRHDMLTFPIGKCDLSETPKEGLIREMREELGIDMNTLMMGDKRTSMADSLRETEVFATVYQREGKDIRVVQHVFELDIKKDEQYLVEGIVNQEPEKCRCLVWLLPEEFIPFCKMNRIAGVADGVRKCFPQWC